MTSAFAENFPGPRNHPGRPGIRRSDRPRTGESEGSGSGLKRESERAATIRGSDPEPPGRLSRAAASGKRGGRPARHKNRMCRCCRQTKPTRLFPLLDDPVATARDWATRHWCGGCLIARGHITEKQMREHVAEFDHVPDPEPFERVRLTREQRQRVNARIRRHKLVNDLLDRAAEDAVFAEAVALAAEQVGMVRRARMRAVPDQPLDE